METLRIECLPGDTRALLAEVDRLGRKARRLGVEIPLARVVEWTTRAYTDAGGVTRSVSVDVVMVTAPAVIGLSGWHLAARLEHDPALPEALVSCGPGVSETTLNFADLRAAGPRCDHCGTRRRRAETYLVRHHDGRQILVGSTCLEDFFGIDPAPLIAAFDWWWAVHQVSQEIADLGPAGLRAGPRLPSRALVLAVAAEEYLSYGWTSSEAAYQSGRASSALLIRERLRKILDEGEHLRGLDPAVARLAEEAGDWLSALAASPETEGEGEYIAKLRVLGRVDAVPAAHVGLLGSAIPSWIRERRRRVAERLARTSQHVGEIKGRIEVRVVVVGVATVESHFGVSHLYTFATLGGGDYPEGAALKYFSSRRLLRAGSDALLEEGDETWIAATVKGHGEFRGTRETVITRGTAITGPTPPPAPKRPRAPRKGKGSVEAGATGA